MSAQKLTNPPRSSKYGDNPYTVGAIVAVVDFMAKVKGELPLCRYGRMVFEHPPEGFAGALVWAWRNEPRLNRPDLCWRRRELVCFIQRCALDSSTFFTSEQQCEFVLGYDHETSRLETARDQGPVSEREPSRRDA